MTVEQPEPPTEGPLRGEVTMSLAAALGIGQTLQRRGLLGEAETVYRQILSRKPGQPEAQHFLGVLLHQMGRREEGMELVLAALETNPNYVDALSNLGNMLRTQDDLEPAETAYRRAIELNPDFADAHVNLAALLFEREQFEEAVVESQRAMELAPQMPQAHVIAGKAFAKEGRHADAAEEYMKAMERNLFHAGIHENMAMSLLKLGRTAEAIDIYRRWIKLDPDNPRPQHHLAACTGVDVPPRASDDYVREVFNRFAATFDERLTALEYSAPRLVIESIEAELGMPQRRLDILDAGCGTGLCGERVRPFARHLTGVDLAPKMLEKARARGQYDELCESELCEYMSRSRGAFDVIISADTLIYFGDLSGVFAAAALALRSQGLFVFTLEKADPANAPEGFRIESHGRYAHTLSYLRGAIEQAGLAAGEINEVFLRMEGRTRVMGWLAVVRAGHDGLPQTYAAERSEIISAGGQPHG
jgi:predicted TPR repeat methyltransferase